MQQTIPGKVRSLGINGRFDDKHNNDIYIYFLKKKGE
jgi:hypothetical protein